jgi:hypothetical protein
MERVKGMESERRPRNSGRGEPKLMWESDRAGVTDFSMSFETIPPDDFATVFGSTSTGTVD